MILAIFDLQVTQMLPTKFRVNWPFGSGEEAINRFSRWLPWHLSWDELHKASVTERFVALRNATVRYQKALRSAL